MDSSLTSEWPANRWIYCPTPNPGAALRLFCFPYAGGNSLIYRSWTEQLPLAVEVCAVMLPGREARLRERPYTCLPPLIEALAEALLPRLNKPFAFFGHSMGALISFELIRELRRNCGLAPAHLFVSGRRAPQIENNDPPTYNLPEGDFIQEIRHFNGTPQEVLEHPELMQLLLPVLRADFAVCETYTYTEEPPLECPISVFGGLQD